MVEELRVGSRGRRAAIAALAAWLGVALASPARAHCGDDCFAPLPYVLWPTAYVLAADGVLTFPVGFHRADSALEFFSLRVVDAQGLEVAGTLELNEEFSILVWRPAAPWIPGAIYTGVSRIDTAAWATSLYGASPGSCVTYEWEFDVLIAAEPLPPPALPPIVVESTHAITQLDRLDALVCCDGAMPWLEEGQGHCVFNLGQHVRYSEGTCARVRERGALTVRYAIDGVGMLETTYANLVARLRPVDEERAWVGHTATLQAPRCLRYEVLDVARGQVFADERCHGEELAGVLGDIERDATAELAACEGPTYVCAGDRRWTPNTCTIWPEGQPYVPPRPSGLDAPLEPEAACNARAPEGGAAGLVAAGFVAMTIRRRRRGEAAR